ncbi:thioredoxin family protein [Fulvivirga lutimaris]|uniref:thioredoxin family protein n=1 Tax=Fulvivirga lutimaris TaxID=1819566 RepID=UPI0012BB9ABB|nr:thioredoxin family protein [Fulvivirga lutimaris]MTI41152.1 thioredoxin [Fulvivirga lutimaris]
MKHYFAILFISIICTAGYAQKGYQLTTKGRPNLVGPIGVKSLQKSPYKEWFKPNYDSSALDKVQLTEIKSLLEDVDSIQVFFGTWCGDSRREVPKFLRILDDAKFKKHTIIGVSNTFEDYKQSPFGEEAGMNIHRVPTFVFYKGDKETGRIVESPIKSLEEDIIAVLAGDDYDPNYRVVAQLNTLFQEREVSVLNDEIDSLVEAYTPMVMNMYELNTYALKLLTSFQIPQAQLVYKINCRIFKEEYYPFYSMGRYYLMLGDHESARLATLEGLRIEPENDYLKSLLAEVSK